MLQQCCHALVLLLQWDQLRAPGGASMESQWRGCELRMRRPSGHPVGGFEYLVFPKSQLPQVRNTSPCHSSKDPMKALRGVFLLCQAGTSLLSGPLTAAPRQLELANLALLLH